MIGCISTQKNHTYGINWTHIVLDNQAIEVEFMKESTSNKNTEFYTVCNEYFMALRKKGKNDDGFEDEFFYTMPVISGNN
jgi:hypothetical protein